MYWEMASRMRDAGESALLVDVTKVELSVLRFFTEITHLTIRGGGRKCQLEGLPASLQDLCLLEVEWDTLDCLQVLADLRVLDCRFGKIHHPEGLAKCAALQVLDLLRAAGLNDLDFIQNWIGLKWIKIEDCMTIKRFPDLKNLHSLKRVIVERCKGLNDLSAFTSAPNLEDLILLEMYSIKSATLSAWRQAGIQCVFYRELAN